MTVTAVFRVTSTGSLRVLRWLNLAGEDAQLPAEYQDHLKRAILYLAVSFRGGGGGGGESKDAEPKPEWRDRVQVKVTELIKCGADRLKEECKKEKLRLSQSITVKGAKKNKVLTVKELAEKLVRLDPDLAEAWDDELELEGPPDLSPTQLPVNISGSHHGSCPALRAIRHSSSARGTSPSSRPACPRFSRGTRGC